MKEHRGDPKALLVTKACSDPLRSLTAAPGAEGAPAQSRGAARTRLLARSGVESRESFRTGSKYQMQIIPSIGLLPTFQNR